MVLSHHYLRSTILALFSLDGPMISFKGVLFPKEIILYAAFFMASMACPIPVLEEIRADHSATVVHAALNCWLINFSYVPSFFKQAFVADGFPYQVAIEKSSSIYAGLETLNLLLVQTGLISFVKNN